MAKKKPGKKKHGRKVRVHFKQNRQARPRDRSLPAHLAKDVDDHDKLATPQWETVSPKGELSRKRTVIEHDEPMDAASTQNGTVMAVRGLMADVRAADGRVYWCTVRRVLRTKRIEQRHPVVVGDQVKFTPVQVDGDAPPEGVIHQVAPRRTELCRADERRTHIIAANIDQVVVIASMEQPTIRPSLIDRYLVSAHAGGMDAVVCINKVDLDRAGEHRDYLNRYRRIGYPVVAASAVTGDGVDELRELLRGKSTVLSGQSGVGKSSLLNAIQPGLQLRTSDISKTTEKGRHTTTTAELLPLAMGGYVVDTPGIRAFELAMVPLAEVELHFVEFAPYLPDCKFSDCTHIHEDECAVRAAVARGEIHPDRFATYVRIFKERKGLVPMEVFEDDTGLRRPSGE